MGKRCRALFHLPQLYHHSEWGLKITVYEILHSKYYGRKIWPKHMTSPSVLSV